MLPYKRIPGTKNQGALDFSWLADAPAGKHGFLKTTQDGHFAFEDGTPVKFMGVNLTTSAALCEKEVAGVIAEDLYRSGVNMVRFHHVDGKGPLSLLDCSGGNSMTPSAANFDRLDYLVSLLKERGIYIHIDLHTLRTYFPDDGFTPEEVAQLTIPTKSIHYYDRRIIDLQKKFIAQYLEHYNPYTKMRYVDDPCVAVVQYVNENGIFWDQQGENPTLFTRILDQMWNAWLLKKYGSRDTLYAAWTNDAGVHALTSLEDPAQGTVVRPPLGSWSEHKAAWSTWYAAPDGAARLADCKEFMAETERRTFAEIKEYLFVLGVKCAINVSNLPNGPADLLCVSDGDVTEHNSYWNHPVGGFRIPVSFHDKYMCSIDPRAVGDGFAKHSPTGLSVGTVTNKPFIITEWNCCAQTRFRVDSLLQMASYGALQDWDGILLFTYTGEGTPKLMTDRGIYGFFDSCADPAIWGYFGIASAIFRKGLVKRAENRIDICFSPQDWKAAPPDYGALHAAGLFVSRVRGCFPEDGVYEGDADIALASGHTATGDYRKAKRAIVHSDNPYSDNEQKTRGRDAWYAMHKEEGMRDVTVRNMPVELGPTRMIAHSPDAMGILTHVGHDVLQQAMSSWGLLKEGLGWSTNSVTSDTGEVTYGFGQGAFWVQAPGVAIFAGKASGSDLGGTLAAQKDMVGFALLSLDGIAIANSRHMLINAMGVCENSGAVFVGRALIERGGAPVVYDDVRGSYLLRTDAATLTAYALSESGERIDELPAKAVPGGFEIPLGGYAHYELVLAD